jgi:hypothetical protein
MQQEVMMSPGVNTRVLSMACVVCISLAGCHPYQQLQQPHTFTAMPASAANRCEPAGIPFYLPKPVLIIAKNFRNVSEARVGETGPPPIPGHFDAQSSYGAMAVSQADLNLADASAGDASEQRQAERGHSGVSAEIPGDGLAPATFYTYQIAFIPDLTQKYVLQITGGPGEIRAALNLVNGWQFTGLGTYYMKDSSTAQNLLAAQGVMSDAPVSQVARTFNIELGGNGVSLGGNSPGGMSNSLRPSDERLVRTLLEVQGGAGSSRRNSPDARTEEPKKSTRAVPASYIVDSFAGIEAMGATEREPLTLPSYAEIYIYEPYLDEMGHMQWRMINDIGPATFDRQYLRRLPMSSARPSQQSTRKSPPDVEELPWPRNNTDAATEGQDDAAEQENEPMHSGGGRTDEAYYRQPDSHSRMPTIGNSSSVRIPVRG